MYQQYYYRIPTSQEGASMEKQQKPKIGTEVDRLKFLEQVCHPSPEQMLSSQEETGIEEPAAEDEEERGLSFYEELLGKTLEREGFTTDFITEEEMKKAAVLLYDIAGVLIPGLQAKKKQEKETNGTEEDSKPGQKTLEADELYSFLSAFDRILQSAMHIYSDNVLEHRITSMRNEYFNDEPWAERAKQVLLEAGQKPKIKK